MANPILLPHDFASYNFIDMAKKESNAKNKIRYLAMVHIQEGKTLMQIAKMLKIYWKTIQLWLANFRKFGLIGLLVKERKEKARKLDTKVEDWISSFINELSESDSGGYITGKQLHGLVEQHFKVKCCLRTIYNTLHRLKFSWITSRSKHPKSDLEVQDLYKKFCKIGDGTNS